MSNPLDYLMSPSPTLGAIFANLKGQRWPTSKKPTEIYDTRPCAHFEIHPFWERPKYLKHRYPECVQHSDAMPYPRMYYSQSWVWREVCGWCNGTNFLALQSYAVPGRMLVDMGITKQASEHCSVSVLVCPNCERVMEAYQLVRYSKAENEKEAVAV